MKAEQHWWRNVKRSIVLVVGWVGFALLLYQIILIDNDEQAEYDPYAILGLHWVCCCGSKLQAANVRHSSRQ